MQTFHPLPAAWQCIHIYISRLSYRLGFRHNLKAAGIRYTLLITRVQVFSLPDNNGISSVPNWPWVSSYPRAKSFSFTTNFTVSVFTSEISFFIIKLTICWNVIIRVLLKRIYVSIPLLCWWNLSVIFFIIPVSIIVMSSVWSSLSKSCWT